MRNIHRPLPLLLLTILLSACGGSGGSDGGSGGGGGGGGTTGSVDLSWDVPTQRFNGDPLNANEIGGYRVLMSKNNAAFNKVTTIDAGPSPSYTVTNLSAGDYRFVVVTYDVNGDESPYSNIISTTFQ